MIVHDVFTPDEYPEYTYVERDRGTHEENLQFRLRGSPSIISLSGPSKSGKTMLLNNVVEKLDYRHVTIHGSNINSVEDIWNETLDQLNVPESREVRESSQEETVKEGNAGLDIPGVSAGAGGSKRDQESTEETFQHGRTGLKQIAELVNLDEFVIYIDDAHYIDENKYSSISEGIKDAYERGMSICVAFIPYRSDDLTRANPDLSGRIESISLDYWDDSDLEEIGKKGFDQLNRYPSNLVLKNLARESVGSPHLMQRLCLEMCNELNIIESKSEMEPLDAEQEDLKNVLRKTANNFRSNYSTIFELLGGGVSSNGNGRKKYKFELKGEGDIYDILLRAFALNPPKLTLDRTDIINRVEKVCNDETPQSGNIVQTIQRIDGWISEKVPQSDYSFEWIDERKCVEVPDPYLIFCLRWSDITDYEPGLQ